MAELVFLDTSFVIALEDGDDQYHQQAHDFWQGFVRHPKRLITTTFVFDEVVTFLKKRIGYLKAAEVGNRLLESFSLKIIQISEKEFSQGWELFLRYKDKGFSFTDCVSFHVMQKMRIKEVLTFDVHFKQMGFKTLPAI